MSLRIPTTGRRAAPLGPSMAAVVVALSLGAALGARSREAVATRAASAVVDPGVRTALAAGRPVTVLAVLREQADVRTADGVEGKEAKGRRVYAQLVRTAEATQSPLRALLTRRGVAHTSYFIVNAVAFDADEVTVAAVAALDGVERIQPLPTFAIDPFISPVLLAPHDASAPQAVSAPHVAPDVAPDVALDVAVAERNLKAIGADKVWRQGFLGAGATVAIIDTGVNVRHPALAGRYRGRVEGDDHNWFDAVAGQDTPVDVNDHGTHVAGIVLGKQGSREVGVAPEAEWIACRVFAQSTGGSKAILDCLQWVLAPTKRDGSNPSPDRAPDIVNASWGVFGRLFCDNPFPGEVAIRNLVAAGILFVAAAGNDGPRCGSVCPPGSLDIALTVGNYDDERREITASSSRGPFVQGGTTRIKPDVAAPGENINSSIGTSGFGIKQGTSMAAPHVSGAAALVLSARPELRGHVAMLRAVLEESATPLNADQCGPSGARDFNNSAGHGVIDAEAAVALARNPTTSPAPTLPPTATATPSAAATATRAASATATATASTTSSAPTATVAPSTTARSTSTVPPTAPQPTATATATATAVAGTPGATAGRICLPFTER